VPSRCSPRDRLAAASPSDPPRQAADHNRNDRDHPGRTRCSGHRQPTWASHSLESAPSYDAADARGASQCPGDPVARPPGGLMPGCFEVAVFDGARVAAVEPGLRSTTYGEFVATAHRLAHGLRGRGVHAGDTVAAMCSNRTELLEVYAA